MPFFDLNAARKAGHDDSTILAGLASQVKGFDLNAARESGYDDKTILEGLRDHQYRSEFKALNPSATDEDLDYLTQDRIKTLDKPRQTKEENIRERERDRRASGDSALGAKINTQMDVRLENTFNARHTDINTPVRGDVSARQREGWQQNHEATRPVERTALEAVGDTGLQLLKGGQTIAGAVPSLIAPDSDPAQFFKKSAEFFDSKQSESIKRRVAASNRAITAADADGIAAQMAEAASQYWDDPGLAARFVFENLPSMLPGIGITKVAQAAALARGATALKAAGVATTAGGLTNAVLNGGGARGEAFEDIKNTLMSKGMSEADATEVAKADSLLPAAIGAGTGFISGKTGLEKAIVGGHGIGGAIRRGATAGAVELAGQQIEESAPKMATNYQAGQYDDRSMGQDVGRTMVETAIGSAPGAAIAGGVSAMDNQTQAQPAQDPVGGQIADVTMPPATPIPNAAPDAVSTQGVPAQPVVTERPLAGLADFETFLQEERADIQQRRMGIVEKQAATQQAEIQRRMESELETTDARVQGGMQRTAQERRIADIEQAMRSPNPMAAFADLRASQDLPILPEDVAIIKRRMGQNDAFQALPEGVEPSLPDEGMSALVPERSAPVPQSQKTGGFEKIDAALADGFKLNGKVLVNKAGKKINLNLAEREYLAKLKREGATNAEDQRTATKQLPASNQGRSDNQEGSGSPVRGRMEQGQADAGTLEGRQRPDVSMGDTTDADVQGVTVADSETLVDAPQSTLGETIAPQLEPLAQTQGQTQGTEGKTRPYSDSDAREAAIDRLKKIADDRGLNNQRDIRESAEYGASEAEIQSAIDRGEDALEELANTAFKRNNGLKQGFGPGNNDAALRANMKPQSDREMAVESLLGRGMYELPEADRARLLKAAKAKSVDAFEGIAREDRRAIIEKWLDAKVTPPTDTKTDEVTTPSSVKTDEVGTPAEAKRNLKAKEKAEATRAAKSISAIDPRVKGNEVALMSLAKTAGWAQRGGHVIRTFDRTTGREEVTGRTKWVPREKWYADLQNDARLRPEQMVEAARKAIAGEAMSAAEHRAVTGMLHALDEERTAQNPEPEYDPIANEERGAIMAEAESSLDANTDDEIDALIAASFDGEGISNAEIERWLEEGSSQAQAAENSVNTEEVDAGRTPEGGFEGGAQAGVGFDLTSETPEQAKAREEAQAAKVKADQEAADKAEADAKKKRIAAEVASRQKASAENFVLGQDAEDAIAGQGDIFSQPTKSGNIAGLQKAPDSAERFEAGSKLTKEERKSVLKTLTDVYRSKRAEKEERIAANGETYLAYPHQPELFEKSDITGKMVRFYVTLPDGRIAHPTELFPDYSQADVDRAIAKQVDEDRVADQNKKYRLETLNRRMADSLNDANRIFNKENPGRADYVPAILTDGKRFIRTAPENAAKDVELLGGDWQIQDSAERTEAKPADTPANGEPTRLSRNAGQETADLLIQHNLSAANLLHAQRMGGIPVPSLAVTHKDSPLTGFGEITLLGTRNMADPKGYAGTRVFGADIYSPRYPKVEYQFTTNMQKRVETMLKEGIEATGGRIDWDEVADRGPEELARSAPFMWKVLKESGIEPSIVRVEPRPLPAELAPFNREGVDSFDLQKAPEFVNAVYENWTNVLTVAYDGDRSAAEAEAAQDRVRGEERGVDYRVRDAARSVERFRRESAQAGKIDSIATKYALERQIREADLNDKADEEAKNVFDDIGPNERIRQGFTNSGKRKYTPHTLENVVNILKKELRGGEGFNYGVGSIRSKFTPQFRTIKQIREAKGRLMDKAAFEKVKAEIDSDFDTVSSALAPYHSASDRLGFGDTVSSMMYDAATMGVSRAMRENGFDAVPDDVQRDVAAFLGKLRDLPTEYFEAKILRDVDLAEFAGAVVPDNVSPEVTKALEARGVTDIKRYRRGDEADRKTKIAELAQELTDAGKDALFSRNAGQGIAQRDAQAIVDIFKSVNRNAPQIIVLDDVSKAPESLLKEIEAADAMNDVEGAFHEGSIYLFPQNLESAERAAAVLTHEGRHFAFKAMKGRALDSILMDIYNSNERVRRLADGKKSSLEITSLVEATEEALADMDPATLQGVKGWKPLIAHFRLKMREFAVALRKAGLTAVSDWLQSRLNGWTDADVAAMLRNSDRFVRSGRGQGEGNMRMSRTGDTITVDDIMKKWDADGIENFISEKNGIITVSKIIVPKDRRGKGVGTKAMQELIAYADRTNQQISLTPSADFGGNKSRLESFYRGLGFRKYKGFAVRETLIRDPQKVDQTNPDIRFSRRQIVTETAEAHQTAYAEKNRIFREEHITYAQKAKTWLRRQFMPGGLLKKAAFDAKIARDNELASVEFDSEHMIATLERAVEADYGTKLRDQNMDSQKLLSEALAGRIPENLGENTKVALLGMRQYIDNMTEKYLDMLWKQADDYLSVVERMRAEVAVYSDLLRESTNEQEKEGLRKTIASMTAKANSQEQEANSRIELIDVMSGNIGEYVHRSYRAFDDPDWAKKIPDKVLDDAREYLTLNFMVDDDMTEAEAANRAEIVMNEIVKNGTAYESLEGFIHESKLGAKDLSVLKKRKHIAPEIRALLGQYEDPRLNFAKSTAKMSRLIFNQQFLERIKEVGMGEFLFTDDNKPPEATTKIAGDKSAVYAPLNGLWVTPETNQAFIDALGKEQMEDWYRTIVRINGMIKYGKTVLSPTTAMRNWMSAYFFTLANGHFNMRDMAKSVAGFKEYFGHRSEPEKLAYLRELKQLGVVYDTPYAGEMMRLLDDAKVETLMMSKRWQSTKALMDQATKFYQYGDDFWKIIGYENEKRMLMSVGFTEADAKVKAATRIRNTYPTYSMVGRGIQQLRRFPLAGTFVSFPAEIIRTSYNIVTGIADEYKDPRTRPLVARRVIGLSIATGFAYGLQALSMAMLGMDDDDEEAARLMSAPWQRNSNLAFFGSDDDGRVRYMDMSFLDPYNYWKRPIIAASRGLPWRQAVIESVTEMTKPFLGVDILAGSIFEVLSNKKDSGGRVFQPHDDISNIVVDIADHLRKAIQPGIAANIERTYKAMQGEVTKSGKEYDIADETAAWFGFRMSTLDPKVALYYRGFDFKDAKIEADKHVRDALSDPNDVGVGELKSAINTTQRQRAKAFNDAILLVNAAKKNGMSTREIRVTLKNSGISQEDIRHIISGKPPEFKLTMEYAIRVAEKSKKTFGAEGRKRVMERYRALKSYSEP